MTNKPKVLPKKEKYEFGLIGYPLGHSFSAGYFSEKFYKEDFPYYAYEAFPLEKIEDFPALLSQRKNLLGLNVTIPYKELVIPYLDALDPEAEKVGAVNTISFVEGKTTGYNTDIFGFESSLKILLKPSHQKALILGSGGAAKAVAYVIEKLGLHYQIVSRQPKTGGLSYADLNKNIIGDHTVIVNTTPLGMYPNEQSFPDIPYQFLSKQHILYDLVYNPAATAFMIKGKTQGAIVKNGLDMLIFQAEKAWEIWNCS